MKNSSSHIRTGPAGRAQLTAYFDGSCPLCAAEIGHYRKQAGASRICFRDIAGSDEQLAPDLARIDAMKRFHVRQADGGCGQVLLHSPASGACFRGGGGPRVSPRFPAR